MKKLNKNKKTVNKRQISQIQTSNLKNRIEQSLLKNRIEQSLTPLEQINSQNEDALDFYLQDENYESVNAKRKLQQLSGQLSTIHHANSQNKIKNSIEPSVKNQTFRLNHQNQGWRTQDLDNRIQQSKSKTMKKRTLSASLSEIRETLKTKTTNQKKYSLNPTSANNKIKLTFNNLPLEIQAMHQNEILRQIVQKQKSSRPITVSDNGMSSKLITIFDKDNSKINQITTRIHSLKQNDLNKNTQSTFKDNDKFLKTISFNSLNKQSIRSSQKKTTKVFSSHSIIDFKDIKLNPGSVSNQKRNSHTRTNSDQLKWQSDQLKWSSKENSSNQKYKFSPFSRKNIITTQKKTIRDKKINNLRNFSEFNSPDCSFNENNKQNSIKKQTTKNQDKLQYARNEQFQVFHYRSKSEDRNSRKNNDKKAVTIPSSSNLQQDFEILINLLKQESQNIFGGQLHRYLSQIKSNLLNSYYCSGGLRRKKNGRSNFDFSKKDYKKRIPQMDCLQIQEWKSQKRTKTSSLIRSTTLSSTKKQIKRLS